MTFLMVWGEFLDITPPIKDFNNHCIGPHFERNGSPVGKANYNVYSVRRHWFRSREVSRIVLQP